MGTIRVLREGDIRAALDMPSCIDAMERSFAAYSSGHAELPAMIHLEIPERRGEIHVKAGHIHDASHYAVKFASGFPGNAELGLATSDGMVVVFDARTGAPAAFLMDHGFITDVRTGAAGGVAARYLAPERVRRVGVLGTGAQARFQLDALACERRFTDVRVWGRNPGGAASTVAELRDRTGLPGGASYATAGTVRDAVDGAEVVITATASCDPLVEAEWLSPGAHVTALGSDAPPKRELVPGVLARADVLVVDSRDQCLRLGELHHGVEAGAVTSERAVELGDVVAGRTPGRTSADQLTVCDLTGVGVQDVAAAALVMERAGDRGERLEL